MVYTRAWDSASPLGTAAASSIDDIFRNLKVDLEERLEDKFIADVAADPWVVKPEILGLAFNKNMAIHHSGFTAQYENGLYTTVRNTQYLNPFDVSGLGPATATYWAPLRLPYGVTLNQVNFLLDRQGQAITIEVGYVSATTGAFTSLGTLTNNTTAGVATFSLLAIAHVVLPSNFYIIRAALNYPNSGNGARLYGAYAVYDTPNCTKTL